MLFLYIVISIVALLVLILLIPVNFIFSFKTEGDASASLRANWLFGLVGWDLRKRARKSKPQKTRRWNLHRIRQIVGDLKTLSALMRLARRMILTLKFKRFSGYLKLGLDDPASTGIAFVLIQPLFACLPLPATADFRIEPDFTNLVFEVEVEGTVRTYPLQVAGVMLKFICSSTGWHAVKRLARSRKY